MVEGRSPAPPAWELLGWRLEAADPDAGTIRVAFDTRPEFLNPHGTVQGGLLVAMLDDTMAPAASVALQGAIVQTLELKASFLRAARPGRLQGDARVVHRGREIVFVEGRLTDAAGRLVATATSTARVLPTSSGDARAAT